MALREKPITSVFTAVVSEVAYLLQTEIRLARAEIAENFKRAANGGVLIAIAGVLLFAALLLLLLAAVRWLEVAGLPTEWGLLIVGGVTALIGGVLAAVGVTNLKRTALIPERTIEQVRSDLSI